MGKDVYQILSKKVSRAKPGVVISEMKVDMTIVEEVTSPDDSELKDAKMGEFSFMGDLETLGHAFMRSFAFKKHYDPGLLFLSGMIHAVAHDEETRHAAGFTDKEDEEFLCTMARAIKATAGESIRNDVDND